MKVSIEWFLGFCSNCQVIVHDITSCRWKIPLKVVEKVDRGKKLAHVLKKTIQKYVEKKKTIQSL